jgi:hypothetical protein
MLLFFEEKDLVSFGNYLFSDERISLLEEAESELSLQERMEIVTDADLANWKAKQ